MTSKYHGAKAHSITCQGVELIQEDGSIKIIYAEEGHKKRRLVHKQDRHQVKRCEACQKLQGKTRNRASKSPVKAWRRLMEFSKDAQATLKEFRKELDTDEIEYLEGVVEEGDEAKASLKEYEANK